MAVVHGQARRGRTRRGPAPTTRPAPQQPEAQGLTTIEIPHYQNFIDAIRANDPKILTCDILEGHLSSTLPHLANISYLRRRTARVRRQDRVVQGQRKKANELLTREYRKGFEVPKSFPSKETSASRQ